MELSCDTILYEAGTKIIFDVDHLRGEGTIMEVRPQDGYPYSVLVDQCDDDDVLHDCNGFFDGDVGWMVTRDGVVGVICEPGCSEDDLKPVEDSEFEAILAV